jgi:hypothetical protein
VIRLERVKQSDPRLQEAMKVHYSQPKGFVGRNICYAVSYGGTYYGSIVGGSATLHLAGRDEFFGINAENKKQCLRGIVNNIFFHINKIDNQYPTRNFTTKVVEEFRNQISRDWLEKYGDTVLGYESLVEIPRTGELYLRDGWTLVGRTIGDTCKRVAGKGTDSWTGKRVWNTSELRPKLVLCRNV